MPALPARDPAAEARSASASADERPLSRRLVLLLAIACGTAVANLYYVQPLLNVIGAAFGVSDTAAALLVTCAQAGYLVGLALIVPLGDLLERRRLVGVLLLGAAAAAAACAAAPSFAVLAVALVAIGATSGVAMILVPLAATLAGAQERGQVVGTVMSGLLIGILLSRTLSGLIAELGGWRLVFALAALAMLALAVALRRGLSPIPPVEQLRYAELLRSVLSLIGEEPVLRQRMLLGAMSMGGFAVLWTSIAFLLAKAPYGYGEGVIGLFGLAGVAGALAAPVVGRLADRGHARLSLIVTLVVTLAGWGLLALGSSSLPALIAGIALFDAGVQGSHINNQSAIYRLRPEARSRMTTAYMVAFFAGGVAGSVLSATVYAAAGWSGACALGAAFALIALAAARRVRTGSGAVQRPGPAAGRGIPST
jgi:predicted MFS family arabinose efflux permease